MRYLQHDLIRAALAELSDAQFQELAWKDQIPGELHSFEECLEMLYTDSGLTDALESSDAFSPEIDARFGVLQRLANQIDPRRSVEELLNDPILPRVRILAGELLSNLK